MVREMLMLRKGGRGRHRMAKAAFSALVALALAFPASAQACQMLPIVYFRHGGSAIDEHGRAVLDDLAAQLVSRPDDVREILITGHSDRTGPASARLGVALERAAAVRDYLLARGLVAGWFRIEGAADSRPMVETADGVREPQNRRAEIALSYTPEAVAEMVRRRDADAAAGRPTPMC